MQKSDIHIQTIKNEKYREKGKTLPLREKQIQQENDNHLKREKKSRN